MERWTAEEARRWWQARAWICGFNFLPSSAVNFLEMWRRETFDRETIERELGWAGDIGFNAVRVNLHSLVWQHERDGLLERLDWLMAVAAKHDIDTVPCLFDDCGFGGAEPVCGPQPDPVPGVHNSRAVASPGRAAVMDRSTWPALEDYVRDVTSSFRDDNRVLFWDLYNEPGNRMIFGQDGLDQHDVALLPHSYALMQAAFDWARAENPEQPLTVAAWATPLPDSITPPYQTEIDRAALDLSDIVSFHAYWSTAHVRRFIDHLAGRERPMICTEWMARGAGSRIEDQLPMFKELGVGCFQWGLVKGRTQTHLPWPTELVTAHGGNAARETWFHDILCEDGRAYDQREIDTIAALTGKARPKVGIARGE